MTCYFRHLEIFKKAGIEVTSKNKREVDRTNSFIKNKPESWLSSEQRIWRRELGLNIRLNLTQELGMFLRTPSAMFGFRFNIFSKEKDRSFMKLSSPSCGKILIRDAS